MVDYWKLLPWKQRPRGFEPQEGFNSRRRTPQKSWSRGEDRFQTPHPNLRNPGSSCPRLLPCSDHPLLPFLPPPSPPFSCPQGAPTLGKNVPFWLTLAMVTAHPHPRAPQQRGLALRAACKGKGGGGGHTSPRPADTPRLPWLPRQPGALRSAQSRNSKGFSPVPLTLLIRSGQDPERDSGVPQVLSSSNSSLFRKKRQSKGPREPST